MVDFAIWGATVIVQLLQHFVLLPVHFSCIKLSIQYIDTSGPPLNPKQERMAADIEYLWQKVKKY